MSTPQERKAAQRKQARARRKARDAARASGIDFYELVRLWTRFPDWKGGSRVPRKGKGK